MELNGKGASSAMLPCHLNRGIILFQLLPDSLPWYHGCQQVQHWDQI